MHHKWPRMHEKYALCIKKRSDHTEYTNWCASPCSLSDMLSTSSWEYFNWRKKQTLVDPPGGGFSFQQLCEQSKLTNCAPRLGWDNAGLQKKTQKNWRADVLDGTNLPCRNNNLLKFDEDCHSENFFASSVRTKFQNATRLPACLPESLFPRCIFSTPAPHLLDLDGEKRVWTFALCFVNKSLVIMRS